MPRAGHPTRRIPMASTPEGSPPPGDQRSRRKRPAPPTIDLTATEVASGPPRAAPAEAPPAAQAPAPEEARGAPAGEPETAAGRVPESESAAWVAVPEPPAAVAQVESA